MEIGTKQKEEGSRFYQYFAGIAGTLGVVSSEMHYGWPSASLATLKYGNYTIHIEDVEASWLAIVPLIGSVFGAVLSVFVIDSLGRRSTIMMTSIPFFISWLMIGLATTSVWLHVARFIGGFTDGLTFGAVPIFLGEIADPKIRGLLSSLCPLAVVTGVLMINVIGGILDISTTAYVACTFPTILLLTFIWIPESPYFLLMKGRVNDAMESLKIFRGAADVEKELVRLTESVKEENENHGRFLELFKSASNRKALIIVLGLRSTQQLCGITAITIYCHKIFVESKTFLSPNFSTMIYFSVQLVISTMSSFLVDISGRRPLIIISLTGTTTTLLIGGTYLYFKDTAVLDTSNFEYVLMITLLCYIVIFSVGLQTIPLLVMSEMFPTNVKVFALSIADIYFSIIAACVSQYFHAMNNAYGMHVPFYSFAVCGILGLVFVVFCVPETKGRTLEDIQLYLKGRMKM